LEFDLLYYCKIDLLDFWRFDIDGKRKLTARRIGVLIQFLPADSATHLALGSAGWKLSDYLLAHLFQAFTGTAHPALPASQKSNDPIRAMKIEEFKKQVEERKQKIASGEIV